MQAVGLIVAVVNGFDQALVGVALSVGEIGQATGVIVGERLFDAVREALFDEAAGVVVKIRRGLVSEADFR